MRPAMPPPVPSVSVDSDNESDSDSDNDSQSSDGSSSTTWQDYTGNGGALDVSTLCDLLHQQNRDNDVTSTMDEILLDIVCCRDSNTENNDTDPPTLAVTMQAQIIMGFDGFVVETRDDLTLLVEGLKAMAHTTVVTKLSINVNGIIDDPQRSLILECCSPLLELVANTTVKNLVLEGPQGSMPLPLLDLLLQQTPHLERLECFNVVLQGTQEDLDRLCHTVAQHLSLQKVQLFFLQLCFDSSVPGERQAAAAAAAATTTSNSTGGAIMDGLVQALLKIPTLTTLGIWTRQSAVVAPTVLPTQQQHQRRPPQELVSFHTLLQTCQSNSLTNLEVPGYLLTPSQLQQVAHQLLAPDAATPTTPITTTTRSSLEHVHFKCNDLAEPTCRALARLIRSNMTLKSMRLDILHPQAMVDSHHGGLLDLVQALASNTTLHTLQLVGELHDNPPIDTPILDALQEVLQTNNFTLQELIMLDCPLPPTLEFYLDLNRSGRATILHTLADTSNTIAWLQQLHHLLHHDDGCECECEEHNDNIEDGGEDAVVDNGDSLHLLDLYFYYLSMNPSLISAGCCS